MADAAKHSGSCSSSEQSESRVTEICVGNAGEENDAAPVIAELAVVVDVAGEAVVAVAPRAPVAVDAPRAPLMDYVQVILHNAQQCWVRLHGNDGVLWVIWVQICEILLKPLHRKQETFSRLLSSQDQLKQKRMATKAELKLLKDAGLIRQGAGNASLVCVESFFSTLQQMKLGSAVVCSFKAAFSEPYQASDIGSIKELLKLQAGFIVPLPDLAVVPYSGDPAALKLTSYKLSPADMGNQQCSSFMKTLQNFQNYLQSPVVLSREANKAGDVSLKTTVNNVLCYAGFAVYVHKLDIELLSLLSLCSGELICGFISFLTARPGSSDTNHSYREQVLGSIRLLVNYTASIQAQHSKALLHISSQISSFKKQLHSISKVDKLNTHQMCSQGTALPFDELAKLHHTYALGLLEQLGSGQQNNGLATQLVECLFGCLHFSIPPQRATAIRSLQICLDQDELFNPAGNCISKHSVTEDIWSLTFNQHKNTARGEGSQHFQLVQDCVFVQLLDYFLMWGQDSQLETLAFPELAVTQGCIFLKSSGAPHTNQSWLAALKSYIMKVSGRQLSITSNVLRHLAADSEMVASLPVDTRQALAATQGHNLTTEEAIYKSPATPQAMTAAVRKFNTSIEKSVLEEGSVKKKSRQANAQASIPPAVFFALSKKERKDMHLELFGVPFNSNNAVSLFGKLTGLAQSEYWIIKNREPASSDTSDSL